MRAPTTAAACLALLALAAGPASVSGRGQTNQGDVRDMKIDKFFESRPKQGGKSKRVAPRYRPKGPRLEGDDAVAEDALVGVTIWRFRSSRVEDEADMRELAYNAGARVELTPVRIESDPVLRVGQKVRFGIETPRRGFLYVVNRSRYADGATGDPYLVFPLSAIRGGDNEVFAGRLTEVPSRADAPPYYDVEASRPGLVAEELIILVTPEPLDVAIGPRPRRLTNEQVAEWERRWGGEAEAAELEGGLGETPTGRERDAATRQYLLTQAEAPPQTLYRIAARPGEPLMLRLVLRVAGD
jgi:hypothetical protein